MLSLSAVAKQEKNKLSTGSVFIVLLDIDLKDGDVIRVCYNTEDVTWNGNLYQAFPFELGEVSEATDGSDPSVELKVDNTSRALSYYIESSGGAVNMPVVLRVVNTENLNSVEAELEESFVVQKTSVAEDFVTFTLGAEYSSRTRRPLNRYMKNNCPFKYKGVRCGYNGNIPTCYHTLVDCREHDNSKRFGGFPGIDQKGVYI